MDPEKRKRIEELKRKKRLYQEQIKQDEARKKKSHTTIEEEAKKALKQASNTRINYESDEIMNKSQNTIYKYIQSQRLQELAQTNFRELFLAYKPELYDEGTQWYDQNKEEEEEESDNDEKEKVENKPKEPLVVKKNKLVGNAKNNVEEKNYNVIEMTEEEKEKEIKNNKEEIDEFLKMKKRYMERAINEDDLYNMFLNDDQEYQASLQENENLIHPLMEFYDKDTEKRTISALEWSLKYPELLLSCYSKRSDDFYAEQHGLIHIWNLANKKEPEFTFKNQAEITSAIFHPYNPKLIIGGTETGVVMIWDTRGKQTPIYKTPLGVGGSSGSKSHTGDITCLGVIGSINSCHIISLSNGIICSWSLNNMNVPYKKIELKNPERRENDVLNELNVLSMGMQQNDTNNVIIGCDDGNSYQISLNEEPQGNYILNSFKGHDGPIYSIDFHPNEFSHVFATSSADWTTKIWTKQNTLSPLFTLENSDNYVYCSRWSPVHPSILATGDGNGFLDIIDLNKDIETPKVHCKLGDVAINKICWTEDGKRITVGDNKGNIQLFGLDRQLYISNSEDVKKFEKVIGKNK